MLTILYIVGIFLAVTYFAWLDPRCPRVVAWIGGVLWPALLAMSMALLVFRIPFYIAGCAPSKKESYQYWVGGPSIEERIALQNEVERSLR